MLKPKLSQSHVNKLAKFEQKLQQLSTIEHQMYSRILENQRNTMSQLQKSQQNRQKCLKQRPNNIKAQTFEQIIKHPTNDRQQGGNGCWMYLANFIQETHDLSEVQQRMNQRKNIRDDLERIKKEDQKKNQLRLKKQQQEQQWRQGLFTCEDGKKMRSKNIRGLSIQLSKKIPFSLQRELRKKQVEENKKRMEKREEYKRQAYYVENTFA